ncbi:helix-turn-helix transcriptional regulator [Phytoactinopolyspora halotolerans]|uniref:AAA family ATPase n=1 Tax=Phytoactinopolyspora halotolerans TaxID=1981512 RepID=A0A6L9SDS1_9ACTN|nr:AAA family ATPase [Phytoactinopolyspora halotolerans]NEE02698.1 AAA family ATPase [Phytoactinopolyspora halotolerans]
MNTWVTRSTLIGREAELADLRAVYKGVSAGEPAAVLVSGEAGIGKTRLVEEFTAEVAAEGTRVVVGQAVELDGEEMAFVPIIGLLNGLLTQLGPEKLVELAGPGGQALTALLPELGGAPDRGAEGRGRLYEVFTTLLERVAAEKPLVAVVEDLQWADGPSRDLLRFFVRSMIGTRVMLVMTIRADEVGRGHPVRSLLAELERSRRGARLDVRRLSREHVAAQLKSIAGREVDQDHIERVWVRSEGVPFYVEELALVDQDGDNGQLPESLRDLLLVRFESMPEPTQRLIRLMSLAGQYVDHSMLEAVAEYDVGSLESALRDAISAGVIVVDGDGYSFRHALLREAVHDDVLPGEHARVHARYARTLEERPALVRDGRVAASIAHHWYFAHDVERAFQWSLRAADELVGEYAHASALLMLERALELWDQVEDPEKASGGTRVDLMLRACKEAGQAGEDERATALARAALEHVDVESEPVLAGEVMGWIGRMMCRTGMHGAVDTLVRAAELIPASPPSVTRAQVLESVAMMLMLEWRYDEALAACDEAEQAAASAEAEHLVASVRITRASVWAEQGRADEAMAEFARARAVQTDVPGTQIRYHVNVSHALNLFGRYSEAVEVATEGKTRAAAVGRKRTQGSMLSGNAAEPLLALGEWDRAERLITRGLELRPATDHVGHLHNLRGRLALWRGELDTAEQIVAELRRGVARNATYPQHSRYIARTYAELLLARGDVDGAWSAVTEVLREPGKADAPGFDLPLAFAGARALAERIRARGLDDAENRADVEWLRGAAARLSESSPMPLWRLLVEAELGGLGCAGDDPAAWDVVLAELSTIEGPVNLISYAKHRKGAALLANGERAAAKVVLHEAAAEARALGATLTLSSIEELCARSGLGLDGPGADGAWGKAETERTFGLTAREREVLTLIAAGKSNREIGEALFISTKTASVHVSNILAKLGVSGRGEAAAVAYREGLAGDVPAPAP